MIEKWLDYNPKNRPSSNDVEIELEKVDKYFWNNLPISKKEYIKSNNEIKDKIFLSIMEKAQNSKILTIKMDYNVIEKDMDEDRTDSIV